MAGLFHWLRESQPKARLPYRIFPEISHREHKAFTYLAQPAGVMKTILTTTLALAFAMGNISVAAKDNEPLSPYFKLHGDQKADVFPLKETHAEVEISGTIAQVILTQTYTNDGEVPIDATYIFPASTGAAVNGMTMTIGERVLTAKIDRKEEARKTFEKAKRENKSASLLSQERPNVFQMEVARIMPGDEVKLTPRYSELLVPTEGVYEFVIHTAIGPRYTGGGKAEDFAKNPFLGEGAITVATFSGDLALGTPLPLQSLACPSHDATIDFQAKDRATLKLHPASHCLRAEGFGIGTETVVEDKDGTRWLSYKVTRNREVFQVKKQIDCQSNNQSWPEISAWFWHAFFHPGEGPWEAVTVIQGS